MRAVRVQHPTGHVLASEGLSGPQRRILDVLASFEAIGLESLERSMTAVMSDASPTSSSFGNNLGALRTKGLIEYPITGAVQLTADGRSLAHAGMAPGSLDDLHAAWRSKLSGPQGAILGELIEAYPRAIARDELAAMCEASPSSSSYGNNLGALRTLGVIDYPQRGEVVATKLLFPEGLR
jgi:hypothetical protein